MNLSARFCGRFAYAAGRIFDGERTLEDHAVVVENDIVAGVMPRSALPRGMPVRHEPACTIIPGLIDTHMHFMRWQGPLYLAQGVTTVRDVGNELAWILERRDEWQGKLCPRILCVGPLLDGPQPYHVHVARRCGDLEGALAAVRETAAAGVDGLKLYVGLNPAWFPAMAQAGHAAGLKLSIHCAGSVLAAGRAGIDEFFHLDGILADVWPDHPAGWLNVWGLPEFAATWDRQREVADLIGDLKMTATPTLAYWDSQWRIRTADHLQSEEMRHVPPAIIKTQAGDGPDAAASAQWRRALEAAQRFVGLLLARGVTLLAGSDVPCGALPPGRSLWRELALLVEAGMSPQQALCAATSKAAAFLGHPELGRLCAGAAADIVVVRGNPLDRIPEKPDIAAIVRQGVVHRPEDLVAEAGKDVAALGAEPWGLQFALHHARRMGVAAG